MTTDRELMQQALDALDLHAKQYPHMVKGYTADAAEALRARLAQPEQEPVAWLYVVGEVRYVHVNQIDHYYSLDDGETRIKGIPLYTAPPQREWQGLTDEEVKDVVLDSPNNSYELFGLIRDDVTVLTLRRAISDFIRAIEAKLKAKNNF